MISSFFHSLPFPGLQTENGHTYAFFLLYPFYFAYKPVRGTYYLANFAGHPEEMSFPQSRSVLPLCK